MSTLPPLPAPPVRRPSSILASHLPTVELMELAAVLLARGVPVAQVLDELVAVADGLVDWTKIQGLRGPAGAALELADGPLLRAFLRVLLGAVTRRKAA